jgi:N-acetylmuramoyl-L-alanine amidase
MARKLDYLVIHCTATPAGRRVTADDIRRWHLSPTDKGGRGWSQVGYSDMILLDGKVINLVPYDDDDLVERWEITNGATGINARSRHIVYVGGVRDGKPCDTRTAEQKAAMALYVLETVKKLPAIKVCGHRQFAAKACPSFDVSAWAEQIGVPKKNILYGSQI